GAVLTIHSASLAHVLTIHSASLAHVLTIHSASLAHTATGSRTSNRHPGPSLCTLIRPPCASTNPRATANPSPAPPAADPGSGDRAEAPRNATSKTFGRSSGSMPPQASC